MGAFVHVKGGAGRRVVLGAFLMVAALVGGLVLTPIIAPSAVAASPPTTGSIVVNESFAGATLTDTAWTGLGSTCLTGAPAGSTPSPTINNCGSSQKGPVPTIGTTPGYLQLTDATGYTSGTLLYNRAIPASSGVSVEFEQYQYGGTGADGIGFFLVDGATNLTHGGANGGSLGYAQRYSLDGIPGGYIGVGLDVFGNFYNDGEGRGTSCPADQRSPSTFTGASAPNVVTLRGPGSGLNGYCYQASTTDPASNPYKPTSTLPGKLRAPSGTTDPTVAKRLINVQVTPAPNPRVIVQIDFETGNGWQEVLNQPAPANTPNTYKFGFAGSTGGVTDVHLLRNVVVRTVEPLAHLQIAKQVDRTGAALPAVITAGTQIPYQYVVTNAGHEIVTALAVVDDKVAAVTCDATTLPPAPDPAASTVCHGTYTVTSADVAAGLVTNSAQATALSPFSETITSNSDSITVPLVSQLTLTKAVTTAAPYVVGQQVAYSYTVTNAGGSTVSNIAVADNRAAGAKVICDTTNLDHGEVAHCMLTTTLLASSLSPDGSLLNTALASGVTPLGQSVTSNSAQASIQVGTDVRVTKTVNVASPLVGQQVRFTVTGTNIGPAVATGVVINDLLPTGLDLVSATSSPGATYDSATGNWTIPTLSAGAPATLTVVATVNTARVLTNAATLVALQQPDTNPANNTASVTLNPIVPTTDVAVNIFVDSPSIRVGGSANFTISATNNGPQPATGVTIMDSLPSRLQFVSTTGAYSAATGTWTVGDLAVGQTVSVNVEVVATAVGSLQNTVGIATVSPQDVNQSNDVDTALLTVTAPIADLQIVKSIVSDTEDVHVGDFVTYSATVTNAGPDVVPDAVATETLISGLAFQSGDLTASNPSQGTVDLTDLTWSIGSLARGESATLAIRAEVLTAGTKLSVSTVSSATVDDPEQSNNTDVASFSTGPAQLDLEVTKTRNGPAEVTVGQSVSFTVEVTNNGPADATDVALFDPLPPGLIDASFAPSEGSFDPATGIWSLATLPSGQTETLRLTATAVQPHMITNTVTVQSLNESDTEQANNSASASVDVVVRADLAIALSVTPTVVQPDDIVRYTLTVTNNGPNTAENVQAVDPVNDEAILTGFTTSQGSFDEPNHLWNIGTLTSGQTATMTVDRQMTRTGTFLNTMVISQSSVPDPDPTNNQTYITVEVPAADLSVAVSVDDNSPQVGQQVTFTISASNLGLESTTTAVVTSLLPAGLSYLSSDASAGSYDEATGIWTIGTLDADAPAELTITAEVTAAGSLVNLASITSTSPFDPDLANNEAQVTVEVPAADLSVAVSVDDNSPQVRQQVTLTISASNLGPDSTTTAVVTSLLPAGLSYLSSDASAGSYDEATGIWTIGTLDANAPAETLTITAEVTAAGSVVNLASISSTSPFDPDQSNNSASVDFEVADGGTSPGGLLPSTGAPALAPLAGGGSSSAGLLPSTGAPSPAPLLAVAILLALGIGTLLIGRRRSNLG